MPTPIHRHQSSIRVIGRSPSIHLAPRIAPLHGIVPADRLNWVIRRLARSSVIERVAMSNRPSVNLIPLRLAHQIRVHVEGGHGHGHRSGIWIAIHRVAHRKRSRRDQRHGDGGFFSRCRDRRVRNGGFSPRCRDRRVRVRRFAADERKQDENEGKHFHGVFFGFPFDAVRFMEKPVCVSFFAILRFRRRASTPKPPPIPMLAPFHGPKGALLCRRIPSRLPVDIIA